MKTRNFPLKKFMRQMKAQGKAPTQAEIESARGIRTKKDRGY